MTAVPFIMPANCTPHIFHSQTLPAQLRTAAPRRRAMQLHAAQQQSRDRPPVPKAQRPGNQASGPT